MHYAVGILGDPIQLQVEAPRNRLEILQEYVHRLEELFSVLSHKGQQNRRRRT